jgi:hypothetical protein
MPTGTTLGFFFGLGLRLEPRRGNGSRDSGSRFFLGLVLQRLHRLWIESKMGDTAAARPVLRAQPLSLATLRACCSCIPCTVGPNEPAISLCDCLMSSYIWAS